MIQKGSRISNSILMGADYYETENIDSRQIAIGIGENCQIDTAIIDKNARVGNNVIIKPFPLGTEYEEENWVVSDGIVVIPKNSSILNGTKICP